TSTFKMFRAIVDNLIRESFSECLANQSPLWFKIRPGRRHWRSPLLSFCSYLPLQLLADSTDSTPGQQITGFRRTRFGRSCNRETATCGLQHPMDWCDSMGFTSPFSTRAAAPESTATGSVAWRRTLPAYCGPALKTGA